MTVSADFLASIENVILDRQASAKGCTSCPESRTAIANDLLLELIRLARVGMAAERKALAQRGSCCSISTHLTHWQ